MHYINFNFAEMFLKTKHVFRVIFTHKVNLTLSSSLCYSINENILHHNLTFDMKWNMCHLRSPYISLNKISGSNIFVSYEDYWPEDIIIKKMFGHTRTICAGRLFKYTLYEISLWFTCIFLFVLIFIVFFVSFLVSCVFLII